MDSSFTSLPNLARGRIEIWFSLLVCEVIRRGDSSSVEDLCKKISAFIDYFDNTIPKSTR